MGRARNLAVARVRGAGQTIESTLRGYVKGFPSLDRLPPFYRELVDVLVDLGRLKKHLGALDWGADKVREITRLYRGRLDLRVAAGGVRPLLLRRQADRPRPRGVGRRSQGPTARPRGRPIDPDDRSRRLSERRQELVRPRGLNRSSEGRGLPVHDERRVARPLRPRRASVPDSRHARAARPADGPEEQDGTPSDRGPRASRERSALPPGPHRDLRVSTRGPTSAPRGSPNAVPGCASHHRRDEE